MLLCFLFFVRYWIKEYKIHKQNLVFKNAIFLLNKNGKADHGTQNIFNIIAVGQLVGYLAKYKLKFTCGNLHVENIN